MLSYQHAFHAGNHADLLKHCVLAYTINYLNKKDKPYTIFDTHSGSGLYDLLDNRSLKTGEAENGIQKLLSENTENIPHQLKDYLELISSYTEKNMYPGSPKIEELLIRDMDFLVLSELHPQEIENLKNNFKEHKKNVQIHHRNGWEMIKALTPPKTKRGAVLIDPSYEELSDYENAAEKIIEINKKWTNGIIMLWYPLLAYREDVIEQMIERITEGARNINPNVEISDLRLCVASKNSHKETVLSENESINKIPRLYGSGMLVINSPFQLEQNMQETISYLENLLKIES